MRDKIPNGQYNVAKPNSLPVKISTYQRRKMYEIFLNTTGIFETDSILDIGATSDKSYSSSNYIENWYPYKDKITASGIDDASFLEDLYPGMRFIHANGLNLPFEDHEFDVVHSSAVLEHVGGFENQVRFIGECARVARKAIFLTTPNRWFPIEFHTILPFVHWLPKPIFRGLMRKTGRSFFADERNLNLMTERELVLAADRAISDDRFTVRVSSVKLLGWPSNLLLTARMSVGPLGQTDV